MTTRPGVRVLAIMGSGETAPTMAKVHRRLAAMLPGGPSSGALLDTPYGFQENADDITARALEYFERNVGMPMGLAPWRRSDEEPLLRATATAALRAADYVFAGPGSPSYALSQWRDTEVPTLLARKLAEGGIVTFASAAALTLGAWTVPVYEIYKVGQEPGWLPGLDILGAFGLRVAVIPHYDNAEGGNHDTRFCYLGERRLSVLEQALPEEAFILGVDSHTCLILDLAAGTAAVTGLGGAVVRSAGLSEVLEPGPPRPISEIVSMAHDLRRRAAAARQTEARDPGTTRRVAAGTPGEAEAPSLPTSHPLLDDVHGLETRFEAAAAAGDVPGAVRATLQVEELLVAWSRDTGGTDEVDRARATLHSLIVRLGDLGSGHDAAGPLPDDVVALLVELRDRARQERDYALGDRIRDVLAVTGIELRDGPGGTTWAPPG